MWRSRPPTRRDATVLETFRNIPDAQRGLQASNVQRLAYRRRGRKHASRLANIGLIYGIVDVLNNVAMVHHPFYVDNTAGKTKQETGDEEYITKR